MDENADPIIRQYREQISDNDRALVEALNKRLRLVSDLKAYKESRGIGFVDPEREEWILRDLARANRGPVTEEGLLVLGVDGGCCRPVLGIDLHGDLEIGHGYVPSLDLVLRDR